MEIEFPKRTDVLGRIAAQTAKQVIFQKVREAERENIFAEYNDRVGEVINSTVKRFENGDLIVEIGRVEAVLPRKEQSRAESYTPGERIRAVIKGVNRSAKGPQIVLSRTDPALLIKLFEQEVPEIYDGTVMIRGAVREAGDRAKVAVYSRERDVDPVGACVGMKGTRVQAIIRELRGEKIDIVEWSDDPVLFVTNALSPAKVQRVSIVDDEERVMEVVVEDKQLSLAIGKKGQNVRLAAKLTGWRIDIKSEEEKRREVEAQFGALEVGDGGRRRRVAGDGRRASRRDGRAGERPSQRRPTRVRATRRPRDRADGSRSRASRSAEREAAAAADKAKDINLATVRIYKVAELLDTTSQEVLALLKRDHGIELKSASSTHRGSRRALVRRARARQRNISLPGGDMFAEHPAPAKGGAKKAPAPKKAEPPKPAAPVLGPPRLVKTVKPAAPRRPTSRLPRGAATAAESRGAETVEARPRSSRQPPAPEPEPVQPRRRRARSRSRSRRRGTASRSKSRADRRARHRASAAAAAAPASGAAQPAGRFVPPTLRLRIEEPGRMPQPARPLAPAKRPQVTQPRIVQPPPAAPPAGATGRAGAGARPGAPAPRGPAHPGSAPPAIRRRRVRRRPACSADRGRCRRSRSARSSRGRRARACPARPGSVRRSAQRPPFGQHRPMVSGRRRRGASGRRRRAMPSAPAAPPPITRTITLAEGMTVKDLADKLDVRVKDVLAKLLMKRMMMTINSTLDIETAKDLAREFGAEIEMRSFEQELVSAEGEESKPEDIESARAGRHRHGPRRPRQDVAARRHPRNARSPSARPAASRSTSAPTTSTSATAAAWSSSTRPATKRSR